MCVHSYLTFAFFLLSRTGLNGSLSSAEAKSVCVIRLLSKFVLAGSSLAGAEFSERRVCIAASLLHMRVCSGEEGGRHEELSCLFT